MFGLGTGLIIKIVLAVLLAGGGIWAVTSHFKHDRENEKIIGSQAERIAQLEASLASRDADVLELNNRIRARNQKVQEELAQAEAEQARARLEADKARAEKRRSDVKLAEAQRKYQEALNNDERLQDYSHTIVPAAVLERLRSANGEGDDDTVRAGPDCSAGIPSFACGIAAGL